MIVLNIDINDKLIISFSLLYFYHCDFLALGTYARLHSRSLTEMTSSFLHELKKNPYWQASLQQSGK